MFSPKPRTSRRPSINSRKPGTPRSILLPQVIFRSLNNIAESFGPALPVLVREALTFSDKSTAASVKVSGDGWAWFVCGRRLLIWPCGEDDRRRNTSSLCREMSLPSSDLAYRADLVTVFSPPGSQVPSCIAASPEGLVRYWPSIAHEGASVEVNAELNGQECDSLTYVGDLGVILATTTASIVLLTPNSSSSRPGMSVKPLRPPQGWLGGFTRLIPSLIFGSLQGSHSMETKLVKVVATPRGSSCLLSLLAGHTLQQWLVVQEQLHSLVNECHVTKLAVDAFYKTIWETPNGNSSGVQVWLLDVQAVEGGLCILMGAVNTQFSPQQFFYALGTLLIHDQQPLTKFDRFCPVKANATYRECDESELLSCRFLLYKTTTAILYTHRKIFVVSTLNYGEDVDFIDMVGPMDSVLGASVCRGVPLLFTKEHGLFAIQPAGGGSRSDVNVSVSDAVMGESFHHPDPMVVSLSDAELSDMEASTNPTNQLQAAFVHFLRKNTETAEGLINDICPREELGCLDALTEIVLFVVDKLADAPPLADPRWSIVREGPTLGSTSLQIVSQIDDKMRAFDAFVVFLKWAQLWDKLGVVRRDDASMPFKVVLLEYREKLISLSLLKQQQVGNGAIFEQCIRHVAGEGVPEGLTAQDVFYCYASGAHKALQAINEFSEVLAHGERRPQETVALLAASNQILLKTLEGVIDWRSQNANNYLGFSLDHPTFEFLPWTAVPGQAGLRDALVSQHSLTMKYGVKSAGDLALRNKLLDQQLKIADLLLDGWRTHVRSVRGTAKHDALLQQFENTRMSLIKPFITDGEYERATTLAEKYLDLHCLVEICELTNDMERLDAYCSTFSEQNFSSFMFNWYIREGKPGHLLERFRSKAKPAQQEQLARFLEDHPTLSWIHDILAKDFVNAHSTLQSVASVEKDLVQRKKTMVSLAKLTLLASNESEEVVDAKLTEMDAELNVITYQEQIPVPSLTAHGYEPDKMNVLTPSEIIKLYISEHNEDATEDDYRTSLELLNAIDDDFERNELRQSIWCSALLRDSWTDLDEDATVETILKQFFFRFIDHLECSYLVGRTFEDILPPINILLESNELGDLKDNRQFQYFIRMGFDHVIQKMQVVQ